MMNKLSQHGTRSARRARRLLAVGFTVALGACANHGLDDVKPTATTAYRSAQPAAPQPAPGAVATPAPPRE